MIIANNVVAVRELDAQNFIAIVGSGSCQDIGQKETSIHQSSMIFDFDLPDVVKRETL